MAFSFAVALNCADRGRPKLLRPHLQVQRYSQASFVWVVLSDNRAAGSKAQPLRVILASPFPPRNPVVGFGVQQAGTAIDSLRRAREKQIFCPGSFPHYRAMRTCNDPSPNKWVCPHETCH